MQFDFSKITVLIPLRDASPSNMLDLYACASNILINTKNARVVVNFNCSLAGWSLPDQCASVMTRLLHLALLTNSEIEFEGNDPSLSLAQMNMLAIENGLMGGRQWWLNVDADLLLPARTLERLSEASFNPVGSLYVYGFFDIDNQSRQFSDWDSKLYREDAYEAFLRQFGEFHTIHHLWEPESNAVTPLKNVWTGSFMADLNILPTVTVNDVLLIDRLQTFAPGERGYDGQLCKAYIQSTGAAHFLLGANAFHTGVYRPVNDGKLWTHYKEF